MRTDYSNYCRNYYGLYVNRRDTMTPNQQLGVLKRIRNTIANANLSANDDTTPGSKNTEANWGLCGDIKAHYPDPELHIWPKQFVDEGRIAPIQHTKDHPCPLSRDREGLSGCFYSCRVFRPIEALTREMALNLYDAEIEKLEAKT